MDQLKQRVESVNKSIIDSEDRANEKDLAEVKGDIKR